MMRFLVEECGANVRARGDAPLRMAVMQSHLEVIKILLERCGDRDTQGIRTSCGLWQQVFAMV
jgi:hypothetical protein